MAAIRMGRWDCQYCTNKGIAGNEDQCPFCMSPKPEDVQYYLPNDTPVVTDPRLLQEAGDGPNWNCNDCSWSNDGDRTECEMCLRPRDAGDTTDNVVDYPFASGGPPRSDPETDQREALLAGANKPAQGNPFRARIDWEEARPILVPVSVSVLVGAGLLVWLLFSLFSAKPIRLEVANKTWERQIEVQEYKTFHEGGWSLPATARETDSYSKFSHYRQVLDHYETRSQQVSELVLSHYETHSRQVARTVQTGTRTYTYTCGSRDLGNGFFEDLTCTGYEPEYGTEYETEYYQEPVYVTEYHTEYYEEPIYREEPVYRTWHEYDIDRWTHVRWSKLSGSTGSDPVPKWPEPELGDLQRVGAKKESYVIELSWLKDDGVQTFEESVELEVWEGVDIGTTLTAKINRINQLSDISWNVQVGSGGKTRQG